MFETISKKSHDYLQTQLDELEMSCDKDPGVAELVKYLIAYSDEMAYSSRDCSYEAQIGRDICQCLWQISGMDFTNIANQFHFSPGWVSKLNSFIGNYVYDDSGFDFEVDDFNGTITFKHAGDNGRWLQNPLVIVEAAKANRAYYKIMDGADVFTRIRGVKADISKVLELVK
jgi:hypothetical protein